MAQQRTQVYERRVLLGIDPGLANTGWGVIEQRGPRLRCLAYGCISTTKKQPLADRLLKLHDQMALVVRKYQPEALGIEQVYLGQNAPSAFATGQARGAVLVACAEGGLQVGEFSPATIKLAVVGEGTADKYQVQFMVQKLLGLPQLPEPDHAADALAAAICYVTHGTTGSYEEMAERQQKSKLSRTAGARVAGAQVSSARAAGATAAGSRHASGGNTEREQA